MHVSTCYQFFRTNVYYGRCHLYAISFNIKSNKCVCVSFFHFLYVFVEAMHNALTHGRSDLIVNYQKTDCRLLGWQSLSLCANAYVCVLLEFECVAIGNAHLCVIRNGTRCPTSWLVVRCFSYTGKGGVENALV